MLEITENPTLGLYIHLPWCEKKCPYCDFNSHASHDIPEQKYIDALLSDLELELPLIWGRQIETIFFGGGTPSLFSGEAIKLLMSRLRAYLNFSPNIEITLESNPGSAQLDKYRSYVEAGINRLSIGAQSFNDHQLSLLGRIHNKDQIHLAVKAAREAGFDNINLDIMFALPEQTLEDSLNDVKAAISCDVEHISFYQLTIEPNTLFHSSIPTGLPSDDIAWDMQTKGHELLNKSGYQQYEISAFSKANKHCQHNVNYWMFGDYVGIGAGAHGKVTLVGEDRICRRQKLRQPAQYMDAGGQEKLSQENNLSAQDLIFEFMLNALRLTEGFALSLFAQTTGLKTEHILKEIYAAKDKGLLSISDNKIQPTPLGFQFHNDLQEHFLNCEISKIKDLLG